MLAATALVYLLLLPQQLRFEINNIVLPPYRLFLLGSVLYLFGQFLRGRLGGAPDWLVLGACLWIGMALTLSMGAARAVSGGGAQFVDIALAYLFARATIRSAQDLRVLLVLVAPGLLLTGFALLLEALSHQYLVQQTVEQLTGLAGTDFAVGSNIRLGLLRATGPFPHPILAGIFLSSFLALYMQSGLRGWPRMAGIVASLLSFFTVSSATLLTLLAGGILLAYDWLVRRYRQLSWRVFSALAGAGLLLVEIGTSSGAVGLISRFAALNTWSAYYRQLIRPYGGQSVAEHPLVGIGYNSWERPTWMSDSIDNYWLLLAIQYGVLPPLLLIGVAAWAVLILARASLRTAPIDSALLRGVAISLAILVLGTFSVSVWLAAQVWLFMLMGVAVSLGLLAEPNRHLAAPGG